MERQGSNLLPPRGFLYQTCFPAKVLALGLQYDVPDKYVWVVLSLCALFFMLATIVGVLAHIYSQRQPTRVSPSSLSVR